MPAKKYWFLLTIWMFGYFILYLSSFKSKKTFYLALVTWSGGAFSLIWFRLLPLFCFFLIMVISKDTYWVFFSSKRNSCDAHNRRKKTSYFEFIRPKYSHVNHKALDLPSSEKLFYVLKKARSIYHQLLHKNKQSVQKDREEIQPSLITFKNVAYY